MLYKIIEWMSERKCGQLVSDHTNQCFGLFVFDMMNEVSDHTIICSCDHDPIKMIGVLCMYMSCVLLNVSLTSITPQLTWCRADSTMRSSYHVCRVDVEV